MFLILFDAVKAYAPMPTLVKCHRLRVPQAVHAKETELADDVANLLYECSAFFRRESVCGRLLRFLSLRCHAPKSGECHALGPGLQLPMVRALLNGLYFFLETRKKRGLVPLKKLVADVFAGRDVRQLH